MANPKIKFKRSAVLNKRPDINSLDTGELAINTYDGRLFLKRDTGGVGGIDTANKLVNPWTENNSQTGIAYTGEVNITGITTFNNDLVVDEIHSRTDQGFTKIVVGDEQISLHANSASNPTLSVGAGNTTVIVDGTLKVTQEIDCDSTLTVDSANVVGVITSQLINVHNFQATGVTTSFGGFFLKNPALESFDNTNFTFDDNGTPTFDSNPISAGIYADGSANFSGIVTSGSGFIGNLTGNVTGTASNATNLNGEAASYYLNYNNFSNTPTLITNNNQLTNGAGYITTSFTNTNQLTNGAGYITTSFTNTNQLTNGAGFIANISEDTTPQLGASLDMNGFSITGAGFTVTNFGHVNAIGVVTASSFVGDITGNITGSLLNGNVDIADNDKILVGTGDDLKIYHDGTDSRIENSTGDIKLKNTGSYFFFDEDGGETLASFINDGGVNLYYNNSKKIETTNDGAFVTGILTATTFVGSLTGSASSLSGVSSSYLLDYNNFSNTPTLITNNNQLTNGAGYITNVVTGDLTVSGNVSVAGTLSYTDVTDIDAVGIITAQQGININGGQLVVGAGFSVHQAGIVTANGFVGPLTGAVTGNVTGNLTGDVTGDVTGNADTATTLATARNIAGVSFNGSADISLNNNAITNGAGYITTSFVNTNQLTNGAGFITNDITDNFKVTGISTFTTGVGTALFVFGDARVTGILSVDQFTLGNSRFHKDDAGEIAVDDITTGDRIKFAGLGVGISSNSTAIGYGLTSINIIGTGVTISTSGDVANISFPTTRLRRESLLVGVSTTTFDISAYEVGYIDVFRNGVRLEETRDYVANDGSTLVFNNLPNVGDDVDIIIYEALNISQATQLVRLSETATANQTTFTIAGGYDNGYIDIFQNGVKLNIGTDVTATNGTTIVLAEGASVGDILEFTVFRTLTLAAETKIDSEVFTISSTTTTLTISAGYTVGLIDIFLNGSKLINGTDYTATNGTTVTLTTAAVSGDVVESVAPKTKTPLNSSLNYLEERFTASGSQTVFTTANTFTTSSYIQVFRNGSKLRGSDFTSSPGNTITLTNACTDGDQIDVITSTVGGITVPTNNNELTNGAGFITTSFTNTNQLTNGAGFITTSFTNTNQLTNGAGFITNSVTGDFTVSGNVSVGGTLTYEDVTNVDSVGIITARSGIVATGVVTATEFDGMELNCWLFC